MNCCREKKTSTTTALQIITRLLFRLKFFLAHKLLFQKDEIVWKCIRNLIFRSGYVYIKRLTHNDKYHVLLYETKCAHRFGGKHVAC